MWGSLESPPLSESGERWFESGRPDQGPRPQRRALVCASPFQRCLRSSNGQDAGLSSRRCGFESRRAHQLAVAQAAEHRAVNPGMRVQVPPVTPSPRGETGHHAGLRTRHWRFESSRGDQSRTEFERTNARLSPGRLRVRVPSSAPRKVGRAENAPVSKTGVPLAPGVRIPHLPPIDRGSVAERLNAPRC